MEGSGTSTLATEMSNPQDRPTEGANTRPKQNRRPSHRRRNNDLAEGPSKSTPSGQQKRGGPTNPSRQLLKEGSAVSGPETSGQAKVDNPGHPSRSQGRGNRGRGKPAIKPESNTRIELLGPSAQTYAPIKESSRRRANFGGSLTKPTEGDPAKSIDQAEKRKGKGRQRLPQGDDLTSTLTRELSTPPYPDCFICFSPIRPEHAIWSCSPSNPIVVSNEAQVREYCWTSFHIKCIRSWAEKSVKEVADAWRARGEFDKKGDWRCPGCQAKREVVPSGYWYVFHCDFNVFYAVSNKSSRCFCHSTAEPKPPRLSTPHSCSASCSRPRDSACGHPCSLQCHPGPCPPCQIMTRLTCYCPRREILTFRCGADGRGKGKGVRDISCGNVCGQSLNCGKHVCQKTCHDGVCDPCEVLDQARCWCGKEEKQVRCGIGEEVQCFVEGETPWAGRFGCDNTCGRLFDCGKHNCDKPCHPPSIKPEVCPRSPSRVTHCFCGKHTIAPTPSSDASQYTFAARLDCSNSIPTCESVCSKPHLACEHYCTSKCHDGPCPPCDVQIVRPCRCGTTTKSLPCYIVHSDSTLEEKEILCDKPCFALRACGRHQCRRVCCPLASLAAGIGRKGKRRAVAEETVGIGEEQGGLHECDLVCGKLLGCGNHKCEQKDHKGLCPPCLRSSFEEVCRRFWICCHTRLMLIGAYLLACMCLWPNGV
jgi:transcriptional repressor NF-X1